MMTFLIRNRIKPAPGSWAWLKLWLRRVKVTPVLVTYLWERTRLRWAGCSLAETVVISKLELQGRGQNLSIDSNSCLGRVFIQAHAPVTIAKNVVINDGVRLLSGSHDIHSPSYDHIFAPIMIEDYAWVATGSTVLQGVTIGRGAVVAAGAVVTKSVAPYEVVGGNPARKISTRRTEEFHYTPFSWFGPIQAWIGTNSGI